MSSVQGHLDTPAAGEIHRAHRIPFAGWVYAGEDRQGDLAAICVDGPDGVRLGRTRVFFRRPDVAAYLGVPDGRGATLAPGFDFHAALPGGYCLDGGILTLRVGLEWRGAAPVEPWLDREVTIRPDDAATQPHSHILRPGVGHVLQRDDVYLTGPASRAVNGEILALLLRYLPAGARVIDVGCGVGPFGPPLIGAGFTWCGAEVREEDCRELARAGLPHRQVAVGEPLPFANGAFDAAICLEVLEHVAQPDGFLAEIRRVVGRRAIFSVPNFELIPLLGPHQVGPFHLLEPDHKNFFTRFSLAALLSRHFESVEVIDYARLPVGARLGEILPYHLLAIADVAR